MKHTVSHNLGKEKARQVARSAFDAYTQRFPEYSPTTKWESEDKAAISFSVKGMSLNGSVAVQDNGFELDLDVPFLLRPFQGKAVSIIEDEIKNWIGKAERGELG